MKLTVLVDNNTLIDQYFVGEPAVSYYIETDGKKILFDTGYSDIFLKNAIKMNIDLKTVDYVVLSHGHNDHTWGLDPLTLLLGETIHRPTLLAHPLVFHNKMIEGIGEVGSRLSEEKINTHFKVNYSKDPFWITPNFVFLGEVERKTKFEAHDPIGRIFIDGCFQDDYLLDDSALVYKSREGLVIITGCSHSGICNIIEYAKKICCESRIRDVVGGFHLQNPSNAQLSETVEYFKQVNPKQIHACHCTDLPSKIALAQAAAIQEVGVGLQLNYK